MQSEIISTNLIRFLLFIFIVNGSNLYAQQCNCAASYNWMVSSFENNDAGFQYVIEKKGKDDYQKFTALLKDKASNISNIPECEKLMTSWTRYFRNGHVAIYAINSQQAGSNTKLSSDSISAQYVNTTQINLNEKQLIDKLKNKKKLHPIEGVWKNDNYAVGIFAEENKSSTFVIFILKADSVYWLPKQLKGRLISNDSGRVFTGDFYMRDHTKRDAVGKILSGSGNCLLLNGVYWERVYPTSFLTKEEETLLNLSKAKYPFLEKLSSSTLYLRIPSFYSDQKHHIDSILALNDKLIKSTPNLIIDIRNGTGGSDASFKNILPYLYTNQIRKVNLQMYATELNATAFEKNAKQNTDTLYINYYNRIATAMRQNLGHFIDEYPTVASTIKIDNVLPYPEKVGIISNENNGSTDEEFLYTAKQSRKVKIFGRPSRGILDISNMNFIDSPDGIFRLGYCMSKSYRIPKYTIDGIGIQPDFFLDDTVPEEDWLMYVKQILEN